MDSKFYALCFCGRCVEMGRGEGLSQFVTESESVYVGLRKRMNELDHSS